MRDPKTSRSYSMQIVGQDASRVGFYSYDLINYKSYRFIQDWKKQTETVKSLDGLSFFLW